MAEFPVVVEPEAQADLESIRIWLHSHSTDALKRWLNAFERTIALLRRFPLIYSLAPESSRFDIEIRNSTFRTKGGKAYRILFSVFNGEVHILRVRGPGQDWI